MAKEIEEKFDIDKVGDFYTEDDFDELVNAAIASIDKHYCSERTSKYGDSFNVVIGLKKPYQVKGIKIKAIPYVYKYITLEFISECGNDISYKAIIKRLINEVKEAIIHTEYDMWKGITY